MQPPTDSGQWCSRCCTRMDAAVAAANNPWQCSSHQQLVFRTTPPCWSQGDPAAVMQCTHAVAPAVVVAQHGQQQQQQRKLGL